jgi:hypothetical protein
VLGHLLDGPDEVVNLDASGRERLTIEPVAIEHLSSERLAPESGTCAPVTDPAAETVNTHSDRDRSYNASERLHSDPQDRMVADCVRDREKSERDECSRVEAKSPPPPSAPEVVVWVADQHRRAIAASQSRASFNANQHRLRQCSGMSPEPRRGLAAEAVDEWRTL